MTTETETITLDQFVARPPERVWQALTTPDQLARWWAPGDIAPTVGHRFTMDMGPWGHAPCEILEVVEPERLVYTFNEWTLTWRLVAEGTGTRVILEHAGFDLSDPESRRAFGGFGEGWRDQVLPRLAELVEDGAEV